ncbi:MAG: hypothetical protein WCC78_13420, partial [Terriglobales bacterium]
MSSQQDESGRFLQGPECEAGANALWRWVSALPPDRHSLLFVFFSSKLEVSFGQEDHPRNHVSLVDRLSR